MNYRESIEYGMSSLGIDNELPIKPIKDIQKSKSYNCLFVPNKVSQDASSNHSPKKQNNGRNCIEPQSLEHQSSQNSMIDESNIFMIKTIVLLILICLPGNIVAVSIFFKHLQRHHENIEQANESWAYPPTPKSATIHEDLAAAVYKGVENSTETVSKIKQFFQVTNIECK